jgi:plastocyanin
MSPIRAALLGITAVLAFVGVPVGLSADEAALPPTVRIDNFSYTPSTLVVAPGTTVIWTNADDDVHTVVEKERKFKSAALDTNDTFAQTFTTPGEYDYFCSLHPQMVGKIVVKPPGSS